MLIKGAFLQDILSYPPTRALTSREADLLWSFRFYLSRFPGGLTKFLKSVTWSDPGEAKQATEVLMPMWAKIGLDDALELLGPGFRDQRVRRYAVQTLERADDDVSGSLHLIGSTRTDTSEHYHYWRTFIRN